MQWVGRIFGIKVEATAWSRSISAGQGGRRIHVKPELLVTAAEADAGSRHYATGASWGEGRDRCNAMMVPPASHGEHAAPYRDRARVRDHSPMGRVERSSSELVIEENI